MAEQVLNQFRTDKMTRIEAQRAIGEMRREARDMPEMTLEEINEEICMARAERKQM